MVRLIPIIAFFFVSILICLGCLGIGIYVDFFSPHPPPPAKNGELSKTALLYLTSVVAGIVAGAVAVAVAEDKAKPDEVQNQKQN